MKLRTATATLAATATLLTGCGGGETGEPTTGGPTAIGPTAENGPTTRASEVTAPTVSDPIEGIDKYKQDPCSMLTKAQATKLGYSAEIKRPPDQDNGPECEWLDEDTNSFTIVILNNQPEGMAGVYKNKEYFGYFEPVNVAGYPGVFGGAVDDREDGACSLGVGVTDQQVINIGGQMNLGSPDRNRPCEVMKKAAEMAIKTMRTGK
ncbi:DUF3558 domain-containing protein [Haloechinothrix salitolerans]|uniref:DUF3558 domain-containing protein n=1 Tax=Haloechinothrix salitolerans TaxID=926830 RepID=A0ABW2C7F5_9PSEU